MPDGYTKLVGNKGSQLSGGQKQRVAITRAILKDPSILLLDEATSTLDSSSEKVVQEALTKVMRRRTTTIMAHRFSTVCDTDSIIVMHQGKVAEIGNHKELISSPRSLYAQLVSLQKEKQTIVVDQSNGTSIKVISVNEGVNLIQSLEFISVTSYL